MVVPLTYKNEEAFGSGELINKFAAHINQCPTSTGKNVQILGHSKMSLVLRKPVFGVSDQV